MIAASAGPPACAANTGWRDHPRECGRPALNGMGEGDGDDKLLWLCDVHAAAITDMTMARLVRRWHEDG